MATYKVKTSFCEIPVGTELTNVPAEYVAELIEKNLIEEVKKDTKPKEKTAE